MLLSDFDFNLPTDCIAQHPIVPRDAARMLRVSPQLGQAGIIKDSQISQLPDILEADDLLICNDTKVIPAQLYGKIDNRDIGVTLHQYLSDYDWKAFVKPAKHCHIGDVIRFSADLSAQILAKESGELTLRFLTDSDNLFEPIKSHGQMPLPPYIKRKRGGEDADRVNYQTSYAKREGAVAAPTAGLHFTDDLFQSLEDKGIGVEFVTLHVGAGTYLPVKVDDISQHKMHSEYGEITAEISEVINQAKREGRRIIAVGTTSLRLLESAADNDGIIKPFAGETDIFITPGYTFKAVDMLFTNFHLPKSTLFMLVCAFSGIDLMKQAYCYAIDNGYRFFSYGDACLLEKAGGCK